MISTTPRIAAGLLFTLVALGASAGCEEPIEGFATPGSGGSNAAGGAAATSADATTGAGAGTTTATTGGGGEAPALPEELPFAVDDYYAPSGFMGDGESGPALTFDTDCPMRPSDPVGTCHRVDYTKGSNGWAGVYWQYPDGNWGTSEGLPVPAGVARITFSAWSANGGEIVSFFAGGIGGGETAFQDSFVVSQEVTLTTTPTEYTLDVTAEPTEIIGGFGWSATGPDAGSLEFYVDDIQYEAAP